MSQPPTFEEYRKLKHFDALDGVRAVGVVLVIFTHYGGIGFLWLSGWLGVDMFFVLSGFLITTLLLREQEKNHRVSLRNFYLRRVFRIAPVYYLILAITSVQAYARGHEAWQYMKEALPYYATFLNEHQSQSPWPWRLTWTIGIEWKFYLVWPVIAFLWPLGPRRISIAIILTLLFLTFFWLNPSALISAPNYMILILGVIVAVLLHYRRSFDIFRHLMTPFSSIALCVCVALMQLYVVKIPSIAGTYGGGRCVLLYGIVFAFFLLSLTGTSPINSILKSRPFVFVGQRSYSLYLVQVLAADALPRLYPRIHEIRPWFTTPSFEMAILTCLVGLVFSDCLYRWVEKPMLSVGKNWLPDVTRLK